jgi:tRNA_anti-like
MKKFLKVILILFIIGLIFGFGVYMYVFHKPHRNLANEKPAFTLTASELLKQFSAREDSAYKVYGDKALQVSGKIADITKKGNDITFVLEDQNSGVSCSFDSAYCVVNKAIIDGLKSGDEVKLKGKCDGYDPIMGVVLTRCVLVEK